MAFSMFCNSPTVLALSCMNCESGKSSQMWWTGGVDESGCISLGPESANSGKDLFCMLH